MRRIKDYLKSIILSVVLIALLIGVGAHLINGIVDTELRKSTYTRTTFDFHIAAPDKAQVDEIGSNGAVRSIFPYYTYSRAFSKNKDVMLLASDKMEYSGASLLTEGTLIEGSYSKNGAMLDKTASEKLGVGVGDTISYTLLGKSYTSVVSAVYLPSTLAIMEKGIVLVDLSGVEGTALPKAYSGAFVVAENRDSLEALLEDYAGEGNVALTYEQYVELKCGSILPGQSEDEYIASCQSKYEAYRNEVLASAKRDGGQVVDKMVAYELLREKILTTEKSLSSLKTIIMIASAIVFAVASILFIATNGANDKIRRDSGLRGRRMLLGYAIENVITAILVVGVSVLALSIMANGTYFKAECMSVALCLPLPILASVVITLIVAFIYVRLLYRSNATEKK